MTISNRQAALFAAILALFAVAHIPLYLIDPPYACDGHLEETQ